MGTSIAKGAQSVDGKSQGIMILLCDQWRIVPRDLQLLVKTWHDDPQQNHMLRNRRTLWPTGDFPRQFSEGIKRAGRRSRCPTAFLMLTRN